MTEYTTENATPQGEPQGEPQPGAVPPAPAAGIEQSKDARNWGMFCHLAALAGFVVPFGWIIGPLVVWLIKREEFPFVNRQGKEALNFQITMAIAAIVSAILIFVVIGFFLLMAVAVIDLVFVIVATMKANEGVSYRYPIAIRFIK